MLFSLILINLISCEKVDIQKSESNTPIVEGYLIPGQKVNIKVIKEFVFQTDSVFSPIEDLQINVNDNDTNEVLIYSGSGNYVSRSLIVKEGKTYKFEFEYNNKKVTAETIIPEKPKGLSISSDSITVPFFNFGSGNRPTFPDPVKISWINQVNDFYMVVIKNIEQDTVAISFGDGFPGGEVRNPGRRIFRNEPGKINQYELNFMNFSYLGRHAVILIHLNADYAALYKQNGNSSINLTAPISNIQNGLGIFTGLNTDTLLINVNQ